MSLKMLPGEEISKHFLRFMAQMELIILANEFKLRRSLITITKKGTRKSLSFAVPTISRPVKLQKKDRIQLQLW